jgi:predicted RNA-binding protein with TRAM domain
MEKPVKIGDELEVSISELSRRGDGLARVQGYVIFVPNTKQGDNVKVKITQMRSNYANGSIVL